MKLFLYCVLVLFVAACSIQSIEIKFLRTPKCKNGQPIESYIEFSKSLLGKTKATVLELYKDGSFMLAGDLSLAEDNRIFCIKGVYKKKQDTLELWQHYKTVSCNGDFQDFWDLYMFAPCNEHNSVIELPLDKKWGYKLTQILGSKVRQLPSGYINTRANNLVDSIVSKQDNYFEPVKLEKSIFNCECPTENLFLAYKKLLPKDAEARENQRIGSKPAPKN